MSKKIYVRVGVDGDFVRCVQCTCLPSKLQEQSVATSECGGENSLKNWEKWVAERKRIHEKLAKSLDRPSGELVMNLDEDYRKIQEERLIFEYRKINTYFDKYRGNPAFWKVPMGLLDKCDRSLNPTYFAVMTKIEQNKIPRIQHVATPNYMLNEKGVFPHNRHIGTTRLNRTSCGINQIELHKPECEELMVIGKKISLNEVSKEMRFQPKVPKFKTTSPPNFEIVNQPSLVEIPAVPKICFVINGTIFTKQNDLEDSVVKIRLVYESTTNMKIPEVQYIKFENRGLTTLRLYWYKNEKFLLFRDLIVNDRDESCAFYFNKNELILPPEEIIDFPIWFKSNNIGNYFELWEIKIKPKLWNDNFKLIVNLQGFIYPCDFQEQSQAIKDALEERASNTMIRDVLNGILRRLKYVEVESDDLIFSEKELFESANLESWDVEERPKYLYNEAIVTQLKLFYEEVMLPDSRRSWNYSIKDLRMMARQKDIWVYAENQTIDMLMRRQRRNELNGIFEGETEQAEQDDEEPSEKEMARTYCRRLDAIVHRLERPSMIENTERSKYFVAFSVIKTNLFKMCLALQKNDDENYSTYDDCYPSINYKTVNTIDQLPERLVFEKFDNIWIDRKKTHSEKVEFEALPKSNVLKGIPSDDYYLIYKTYFKLLSPEERKRKGGAPGVNDVKVKIATDSKTGRPQGKQNRIITVRGSFDPYAEEYKRREDISECSKLSSTTTSSNPTTTSDDCTLHYRRYLIIYTHLCRTVEAMVDALETMKENVVHTEVLGRLVQCSKTFVSEIESTESSQESKECVETVTPKVKVNEDSFFRSLLYTYLYDNMYTKEYIIEGRNTLSFGDKHMMNTLNEQGSNEKSESGSSFDSSLFKIDAVVEPVKSRTSVAIQTSKTDSDFKEISNIFSISESHVHSTGSGASDVSHDIFYFMDENREKEKN